MKTIVPLTVSLTTLAFLWLLLGQATTNEKKSPPSTSGSITRVTEPPLPSLGSLNASANVINGPKTSLSVVTISEGSIRKAADDEIKRLKEPLSSLFQRWGLEAGALAKVLDLIHDRRVQQALVSNQYANESANPTMNDPNKFYQQRQSDISTHYETELLTIIGSTKRLFEMTNLMGRVSHDNYIAGVPARKAEMDKIQQLIAADVAKLKASHGSNYKQVMRERYGDVSAASMLQLLEGTDD